MLATLQSELQLYPSPYILARCAAWGSAVALGVFLQRRQGIRIAHTLAVAMLCIPISIIGARLLDALEYARAYPSLTQALGRNGSSIYGGLALTFAVIGAYTAWHRISMLRFLDGGAPAMALGEAVSRIGCFLGGCCYGVPWNGPWAVTFAKDSFAFDDQIARGLLAPTAAHSLAVHPVQLYTSMLALGMCAWLVRSFVRRRVDGEVFYRFLVAYGSLRLAMAPLRMEGLASMQLFSAAFILAGAVGLIGSVRRMRTSVAQEARSLA